MKGLIMMLTATMLFGCAELMPGNDTLTDVLHKMGPPAMRWNNPDGTIQLSYPQGPNGPESLMVIIGTDGKLQSARNVLTPENFALIKPGMTQEQVLYILGPTQPQGVAFYSSLNVLEWDWLFEADFFDRDFLVAFDGTTGRVRKTSMFMTPHYLTLGGAGFL